ncbi:extracellular solute-binding protein [Sulfuricystis thermophila]|uniref:extracellular solute-binding protein n=1 Tax=Sulfuricystis thermophila TaxID=2496847 RepID=UPI001558AB07|nr:extracellular solute-binding protein [Sulfuricystis thermophila]
MKHSFLSLAAGVLLAMPGLLQAAPKTKPAAAPVAPPQEIVLRHALSGPALDAFATLVLRFNDAEAKLKSGAGRIVLEDAQGVAERARLPHLALFDEDDALAMFGTRPRFRPLHQVMATGKQAFDVKAFYPQVFDAVDDLAGRMQALPIALSLPVLFYNKTAFTKAGLDPNTPPKTWWEVQEAAGKLREAGWQCPLTSSRFAWVHVENVAAQHGEPLVVKDGKQDRLAINNMVNVKHMALLTSWQKSHYFVYSGPGREGDERFAKGECAMLTGESSLYALLKRQQPEFPLGVAALPHYDDVYGAKPKQVLPDGASLWVLAADKKPEQQVIARFIAFLMRPDVQRDWVRATGFLPMTPAAMQALRESGVDPAILAQADARLSMPKRDAARTKNGFGKSRIRAILDEEVEFVWGNQKPPKAALDAAVARAQPLFAPAAKP